MRQHQNVVDARGNWRWPLVYTSGLGADSSVKVGWPIITHRAAIRDSGLPYTILRHPIYSEWFIHPGLREAVDSGELISSSGGRGDTALRADLAEAAAVVLTSQDQLEESYDFTGRR